MSMKLRRWPVLLLWLALALLPLRGWANAVMHLPAGGETAVAAAEMPCHGDPAPAGESKTTSCNLCDLCHGAAAAAPLPAAALPPACEPAPQASAPTDAPDPDLAGPERPPRSTLA